MESTRRVRGATEPNGILGAGRVRAELQNGLFIENFYGLDLYGGKDDAQAEHFPQHILSVLIYDPIPLPLS